MPGPNTGIRIHKQWILPHCKAHLQLQEAQLGKWIRFSLSESQSPPIFLLIHLHKSHLHAPAACIVPALALPRPVPTDRGQQSGLAKHSPLLEAALPSAALVNWTDSQRSLTAQRRGTTKWKGKPFFLYKQSTSWAYILLIPDFISWW